jgi:RecJ-like exonuclease
VLGIGEGSITVRTNIPGFDLNKLISEMKVKFPYAQIEGGGHKVAGTLHFVEAAEAELADYIKSHLEG